MPAPLKVKGAVAKASVFRKRLLSSVGDVAAEAEEWKNEERVETS